MIGQGSGDPASIDASGYDHWMYYLTLDFTSASARFLPTVYLCPTYHRLLLKDN